MFGYIRACFFLKLAMAANVVESATCKKLSSLRVVELKQELDKRGLEKTGVKAALIDRLKKVIRGNVSI